MAYAERFELLTQTGPETPMGKLLRRFWHPIAEAASVGPATARGLRILGEDLTLYRGESGQAYLVADRCAHRCAVLHTGWVQHERIRCMYHGWQYDGLGQCTERPAERDGGGGSVTIAAYPVHEYCGFIFAYLGPAPTPAFALPRKEVLEDPTMEIGTHVDVWDCNWFQQIENSLDSVHVSFVHQWGRPSRLGEEISAAIPELAYEETAAGLRQTATRPDNVRVSNWTFPNNNHIVTPGLRKSDPWGHTSGWVVPIDDEHTLRLTAFAYPRGAAPRGLVEAGILPTVRALDHATRMFEGQALPDLTGVDAIMLQDYVALRGQGVITDRSRERLGASDAGIALLRRVFFRELDAIGSGAPTKEWTKLPEQPPMPTPAV